MFQTEQTFYQLEKVREYGYDGQGRLATLEHFGMVLGERQCVRFDSYGYDAPNATGSQLGLLTSSTSVLPQTDPIARTRFYGYDATYRLETVTYPALPSPGASEHRYLDIDDVTEVFAYDLIGNRISRQVIDHKTGDVVRQTAYGYAQRAGNNTQEALGLVEALPGGGSHSLSFTWDEAGNLLDRVQTTKGVSRTWRLAWDGRNRLASVDELSPNAGTLAQYRYDYDGVRFLSSERVQPSDPYQTRHNLASAAGDTLYSERSGAGLPTPRPIGFFDAPGIDNRWGALSIVPAAGGGTELTRLSTIVDQVGTVVGLMTQENLQTSILSEKRFDAFGRLASENPPNLRGVHGFTGRELVLLSGITPTADAAPGGGYPLFSYNRARYYDPEVGRFVSPDPAGLRPGPNLYEYARNRPTDLRDPLGLDVMTPRCMTNCDESYRNRNRGLCLGPWISTKDAACPFLYYVCMAEALGSMGLGGKTPDDCLNEEADCNRDADEDFDECNANAKKGWNDCRSRCGCY